MDNLGCTVFAFDPTVDYPENRGNKIVFNKLGIAGGISMSNLDTTEPLENILQMNNHTNSTINYLKVVTTLKYRLKGAPFTRGQMCLESWQRP